MRRREQRHRGVVAGVFVLLAVAVLPLAGCGVDLGFLERFVFKSEDIIVERSPDPVYEQLFPHYVELCTLSRWSRTDGSARGNPFGHAVMYIKGACKDEDAPFPKLRRCRSTATTLDDPEHGAGISVGQWFRNVNWVAVPGYELFYTGNLAAGERLTEEHLAATVQEAIDRAVFDGVELHDGWVTTGDRSLTTFVNRWSVGTDFALQFSRNLFCARIPVTEDMLGEIIAFLNDKNDEYATGEANYNWDLFANNCVHTLRNALAAANVWEPLSVRQVKIRHLFNLAVPANEFVNLAVLGAEGPLVDYQEVQDEDSARDALYDFRWLPMRHGALVKTLPVHTPNEIYTTEFRLFAVQSPFRMATSQKALRLLSDPRYVDLEANLLFFRDMYESAIAVHGIRVDRLASVRGTPSRRVSRLHLDYLVQQQADVDAKLALLREPATEGDTLAAPPVGSTE